MVALVAWLLILNFLGSLLLLIGNGLWDFASGKSAAELSLFQRWQDLKYNNKFWSIPDCDAFDGLLYCDLVAGLVILVFLAFLGWFTVALLVIISIVLLIRGYNLRK